MSKSVLVLTGDGINCERETARAFEEVGGKTTILHVNKLLESPEQLLSYGVFCLPGGFSFGDELKSGKILAEKMRVGFLDYLKRYTDQGGLTIGVCNGFQILIQLGVFDPSPNPIGERTVTLGTNDHGQFRDRWVKCDLTKTASFSPWLKGMSGPLMLPIRHKEGRIEVKSGSPLIPLRYEEPVNGAFDQAAALLDQTGRIFGLMPHPEAATHAFLNPLPVTADEKIMNANEVRKMFKNAIY